MLAAVSFPAFLWLQSVGDLSIYFVHETPPGQLYYIFSKLVGLYAIFLLWLQIILALMARAQTRALLNYSQSFHQKLGGMAFVMVLLHIALFTTAVSIRKGHLAVAVLLPDFNNGFFNTAVALGVLALYAVIAVVIAGYLKRRHFKFAKWVHRLSVPALILSLLHCLMIGTETRYLTAVVVYSAMIVLLVYSLFRKIEKDLFSM